MADLTELIRTKNSLLFDLDAAKRQRNKREVLKFASLAATREAQIAQLLLEANRVDDAVVNLVSQASCYKDANRLIEARRILEIASQLSRADRLKIWIQEELATVPSQFADPGRLFETLDVNISGNPNLRQPQAEAYEAARRHFAHSKNHAIIQLPVGCGKTGTISLLPFRISEGRMLVVAPNLEIRRNLLSSLDYTRPESFLRKRSVLSNGTGPTCAVLDEDANLHDCDNAAIVVTNIQQLVAGKAEKWLGQFSPNFFDLVVLDEGHHNVAPTWKHAIDHFADAKIASFTATPFRADGQRVEGQRIYRFPIASAIKAGYVKDVASHRLEPLELTFTYRGEERRHGLEEVLKLKEEYWFSKGVALAPECNRSIVDHSIQCLEILRSGSATKHQIIAVACSIDHAKAISALYEERNYRAGVLHSNLAEEDADRIRMQLREGILDVVVQVMMLAEGADYPSLSVAAIFRPYRHLVPYVQFVGRIMRVITENSPGHADNRGFVVSHIGLNVDRWWDELKSLDEDDQKFFEGLAVPQDTFMISGPTDLGSPPMLTDKRRKFRPEMVVLEETIAHYVQESFLPEDATAVVDDLINAMALRGVDISSLGMTRGELEEKLKSTSPIETEKKGKVQEQPVQPQRARQVARQRLDERTRAGSKQLLNELRLTVTGFELPRAFPKTGSTNNISAAIVLLNTEVMEYLKAGPKERDLLTLEQLTEVHDKMDELIDSVAAKFRAKRKAK
jgi:DNA repair protein RadD